MMQAPQMETRMLSMAIICQLASNKTARGLPGSEVKASGRTSIFTRGNAAASSPPAGKAIKYPVRFNFLVSRQRVISLRLPFGCLPQ